MRHNKPQLSSLADELLQPHRLKPLPTLEEPVPAFPSTSW